VGRPVVAFETASRIRLKVVVLSKFSKSGGLQRLASGIISVVNVGRYNSHHYNKAVTVTVFLSVSLSHRHNSFTCTSITLVQSGKLVLFLSYK